MVWDIAPEIIKYGPLQVRWYGLLFASGFFIGYFILRKIFKTEGLSETYADSILLHLVLGTTIGARLGHCLFYDPTYYLANPIEILKIWKGGLASHGGTLGNIVAMLIYCRRYKDQSFIWVLDRISIPIALTASFIRIGNFFNSEILGKVSDVPWAITFKRIDSFARHPSQLYESICYLVLFFILSYIYKKKKRETPVGLLIGIMFTWIFGFRILIEYTKENQVPFEATLPMNLGQLLSIPFVIFGLILIFRAKAPKKSHKKKKSKKNKGKK